ncbi:MAG: hypothetical protein IKH88_02285 [Prevotella sp.]|nr:hypothetical protein [Prevotella sp.]
MKTIKKETPVARLAVGQVVDFLLSRMSNEANNQEALKAKALLSQYPWTDEGASYFDLDYWFLPEFTKERLNDLIITGQIYGIIYKDENKNFHLNPNI